MDETNDAPEIIVPLAAFMNGVETSVMDFLHECRQGVADLATRAADHIGYKSETIFRPVPAKRRDVTGAIDMQLVNQTHIFGFALPAFPLSQPVKIYPNHYQAAQHLLKDNEKLPAASLFTGAGAAITLAQSKLVAAQIYRQRHSEGSMSPALRQAIDDTCAAADGFATGRFAARVKSAKLGQ